VKTHLRHPAIGIPALLALALAGCGTNAAPPQTGLDEVDACFERSEGLIPVTLELATEHAQRQMGLMLRQTLPANRGMLFDYPESREASQGFWMYRTLIPLDIAFLDKERTIHTIRTMTPCPSSQGQHCPVYPADKPYWSAVEMNAGFFSRKDIQPGDRLRIGRAACQD